MTPFKTNKNGDLFIHYNAIKKYGKNVVIIGMFLLGAKLSKHEVRRVKKILKKESTNKLTQNEIKKIVVSQCGKLRCDWCNKNSHCLQEHHYPITNKNGGNKTVSICGKCHADYHYIESLGVDINKIKLKI